MKPFALRESAPTPHSFYRPEDAWLAEKMPSVRFLDEEIRRVDGGLPRQSVHRPDDGLGTFLHEAAIVAYKGVLYASWYLCPEQELIGYTPIVGRRSYDGGATWTEPEILAEDPTERILYCPPVYGTSDGKLYLLMNQMVEADHIHSLDLYVLNEETGAFEFLWSRPIPFKLNTNVVPLPNGKLLLPGRVGELDGFPNIPAVLISDSGKIDGDWRLVRVAPNGDLPDGAALLHPETTVICWDNVLILFSRNDNRRVPLCYLSRDFGETWSQAMGHDIPYVSSKMMAGQLTDGRFYLIANTDRHDRSRLSLFLSEENALPFTKEVILVDCEATEAVDGMYRCHYPAAAERNGSLYVIATADYRGEALSGRGAVLFRVDLTRF